MSTSTFTAAPATQGTGALLACGLVAGPLFTTVALVQVLTRDGFDLASHPLSLLSLGDLGWVQISNFVATGVLSVAFAVGMRRALPPGRSGAWASGLYAAFGVGLVAGGIFVTDPSLGFPPGVPSAEGSASWHSLVHDVAAGVALDLALVACLVVARLFRRERQTGWAIYSAVTAVVGFALSWWPDQDGISVRLAVVVVLVLAWATALSARLLAAQEHRPHGDRSRQ
jgi:hypothetical protein